MPQRKVKNRKFSKFLKLHLIELNKISKSKNHLNRSIKPRLALADRTSSEST